MAEITRPTLADAYGFVKIAARGHGWYLNRKAVDCANRWVYENWDDLIPVRYRDVFGIACRVCGMPTVGRAPKLGLLAYCIECGREQE